MSNISLKQGLSSQQLAIVHSELTKKGKSKTTAYLFWFFLGALGAHRYYAGDVVRGIFMMITLGGIGIWALIDVFFIGKRIEEKNEQIELGIIQSLSARSEAAATSE